ncbi:unnamed protein product [Timema podura]|uniref:isopentenyl-diphosphate Delta-isomerase n=1 Tax=Timema podura TaxID=61482 RepID=A0ABN7NJA4_TIMPD|nr:unnamed protein product [Timema podura]
MKLHALCLKAGIHFGCFHPFDSSGWANVMIPLKTVGAFMNRVLVRCYSKSVPVLENLDPLQEASLEERCITVNEKDHAIGNATKRECHQVGKNGQLILHRAFSVFIFNSKGDLLLQRRSPQKITFPDCYTNACCSHPLYDLEAEREERGASGVRKAAQRRLQHELGIPPQEATPESFHYLTRIHYQAGNSGQWGEHEIDYIMILHRDVTLKPNMNEVSEVRYISRNQLDDFLGNETVPLSPWFYLIANHHLRLWWDNLHQLQKFEEHKIIHRF